MLVKKVMKNKVITISENKTAKDAALLMKEQGVGALIVSEDGIIADGIITETDITRKVTASKEFHSEDILIKDFMTQNIITITDDEQLDIASMKMAKNKIKKLVVVDKEGKIKGIITHSDVIAHSQDLKNEAFFE